MGYVFTRAQLESAFRNVDSGGVFAHVINDAYVGRNLTGRTCLATTLAAGDAFRLIAELLWAQEPHTDWDIVVAEAQKLLNGTRHATAGLSTLSYWPEITVAV